MGMSKKCTAVDSLSDASSTSSRGSKVADGPSKKPATIEMSEERKGGEEYSDRRLFISNFPFSWHEDDLRAFLEDYGPVMEVNIVYNERGSKGFGFATIDDPDRCYRARMELNHTIVQGRRVEVRKAHKQKRRPMQPPTGNLFDMRLFQSMQSLAKNPLLPQLQLLNLLSNPDVLDRLQGVTAQHNIGYQAPYSAANAASCFNLNELANTGLQQDYANNRGHGSAFFSAANVTHTEGNGLMDVHAYYGRQSGASPLTPPPSGSVYGNLFANPFNNAMGSADNFPDQPLQPGYLQNYGRPGQDLRKIWCDPSAAALRPLDGFDRSYSMGDLGKRFSSL